MRRTHLLAALAAIALVTQVAIAGPGHKCASTTQECLDKMVASYKEAGWAGMDLKKSEDGVVSVRHVYPGTPAESAGIREGDAVVAMNGLRFDDKSEQNKKALMAAKKSTKAGAKVSYTIARDGKEKVVQIALVAPPQDVIVGWIGSHMIEHASTAVAQN